jgi:FMN phosphatase YigB (HAD superfamily)
MIETIAFDLGGVIMTINNEEPIRRFKEIGVDDADKLLDPYTQSGIFGDLEKGSLSEETFRQKLSEHAGRTLTWKQCQYAWKGFVADVPTANLRELSELKRIGYRLILVSNTNGFIQSWADSEDFSELRKPLSSYFDKMYRSYEIKSMKPHDDFFSFVLEHEKSNPNNILLVDDSDRNCKAAEKFGINTLCTTNGEPWIQRLRKKLKK